MGLVRFTFCLVIALVDLMRVHGYLSFFGDVVTNTYLCMLTLYIDDRFLLIKCLSILVWMIALVRLSRFNIVLT